MQGHTDILLTDILLCSPVKTCVVRWMPSIAHTPSSNFWPNVPHISAIVGYSQASPSLVDVIHCSHSNCKQQLLAYCPSCLCHSWLCHSQFKLHFLVYADGKQKSRDVSLSFCSESGLPAYARTAREGLLPKRLEEDLC